MPETAKRLGAVDVAATTNTLIYAVPASTSTVVSTVAICNRNSSSVKVRLAHVDGAIGSIANEDYIYYDVTIPANDSLTLTVGITMATTHTLMAYSNTANVNFVTWGVELT